MTELKHNEKLKNLVNSSGFPLQIGLAHQIDLTRQSHGWRILLTEHPWQHPETSENGFIDIVVENQYETQVMVIECKRVRDTEWLFLIPKENPNPRAVANTWITYLQGDNARKFNWTNLSPDPTSYQSEFCVVHGQDPKAKPMLERVAAQLVDSTEAFALEEYQIRKPNRDLFRIYVNVIVTTAEIKVCKFKPDDIDIATGEIAATNFETVPWVRFQKSLTTRSAKVTSAKHVAEMAKENERTVFVVHSEHFIEFLKQWDPNVKPELL
jgi:hypothetical protein